MGISVLHVLHAYRPGGMENMIAQMAWRLPAPEFAVAICALTEADDFKGRLPAGTPVVEMKKKSGLDFGCALRLRRLIRSLKPDVVHSHNWNALIYSILAIGGGRTALLHGEHALLYGWERSPWRLRLRQALYARCDVVHTVSDGQAAEIAALGIAGGVDLRIIRNGVDIQNFCPQDKALSREALGIPAAGLCIGMVARCVPEKRHALLLQAFELTAAAFPAVTLVLAGAGGMCESAVRAAVAAHPYAGRILWLGHRNDMATVYNALDLMVLTSTSEGMSNVSLEAMSCGVPVLMHHACGSEELIMEGVNGSASPMGSAGEVAAAVARLLASPADLRCMGRGARAIVERGRPLEKTAAEYADVYRELAEQARA
jgi:glycosyltransferase involved in cell wall biosynthesis